MLTLSYTVDNDREVGISMVGTVYIGRSLDCEVVLQDLLASRRHVRYSVENEQVFVEDLNSSNGSFLNGRRLLDRTLVQIGDVLSVGQTKFVLNGPKPILNEDGEDVPGFDISINILDRFRTLTDFSEQEAQLMAVLAQWQIRSNFTTTLGATWKEWIHFLIHRYDATQVTWWDSKGHIVEEYIIDTRLNPFETPKDKNKTWTVQSPEKKNVQYFVPLIIENTCQGWLSLCVSKKDKDIQCLKELALCGHSFYEMTQKFKSDSVATEMYMGDVMSILTTDTTDELVRLNLQRRLGEFLAETVGISTYQRALLDGTLIVNSKGFSVADSLSERAGGNVFVEDIWLLLSKLNRIKMPSDGHSEMLWLVYVIEELVPVSFNEDIELRIQNLLLLPKLNDTIRNVLTTQSDKILQLHEQARYADDETQFHER